MTIDDLLRRSNLTPQEVQRIEAAIQQRNGAIDARDTKIQLVQSKIERLEQAVADTKRNLCDRTTELADTKSDLRRRTIELVDTKAKHKVAQELKEAADALLPLGRRLVEEKDTQIEQLQAQVTERDDTIRRIGAASADEAMRLANEVSAQRTLHMLQGLRRDVTDRDKQIQGLRKDNTNRDKQIEQWKQVVDQSRDQCRGQFEETQAAKKQVKEIRKVAEDQQELIEKLLKENKAR